MTKAKAVMPELIVIGPIRYTVTADHAEMLEASVEGKSSLLGQMQERRQRILVDPEQGPDCLADTLLHEVLHGVFAQISAEPGDAHEEELVCRLAPLLLDVLRRNPELVAFLVGEEGGGAG